MDFVLVGRVARAHGNKGQVIVNLDTDFAEERFSVGQVLLVGDAARPLAIRDVRFHQGRPVVTFEGVETMNDAEALAGAELKVPASDAKALPEGTFYHYDLVGCEVRDTAGRLVGSVVKVEGTMERSRLVVDGAGEQVLIPLVAPICVRIDVAARQIVIDPPEGLIDLNDRRPAREPRG
jgi:16S rRNA processing protein RimM